MFRRLFSLSVALAFAGVAPLRAEMRFDAALSDHMVVQRDVPIRLGGVDGAGQEIRATMGAAQSSTRADAQGRWSLVLPAQPAGGPHEIVVKGSETKTLKDVLVGEVWFCSGQSNMAWILRHSKDADREIAAADYPKIRMLTMPDRPGPTAPTWAVCSPKAVSYWSGVAYFYGRELHKKLGVPVGLIVSAVNGTRIEPWTPGIGVAAIPELAGRDKAEDGDLYRRMVAPFTSTPIRGVIWYQGEGNVGDMDLLYYHRMRALVHGWRGAWNQGDFPFYFAQIAPLNWGGKPLDMHPHVWAAQLEALKIPNTGMAVTTDIVGNPSDAHPRNKQDVGKRLALWAFAKTYGYPETPYSGPLYKSIRREGNALRVSFDHAAGGLAARDGKPLSWFTIAGSDGKFVPAKAVIDGETVIVSAESIGEPTAVRLGWHQIAQPNLVNVHGLPASPFRSDRP